MTPRQCPVLAASGLWRLVEQGRCDTRPGNTGAFGYIVKDITPILKFRIENRSALERILNQHEEAEDPAIRETLDACP